MTPEIRQQCKIKKTRKVGKRLSLKAFTSVTSLSQPSQFSFCPFANLFALTSFISVPLVILFEVHRPHLKDNINLALILKDFVVVNVCVLLFYARNSHWECILSLPVLGCLLCTPPSPVGVCHLLWRGIFWGNILSVVAWFFRHFLGEILQNHFLKALYDPSFYKT